MSKVDNDRLTVLLGTVIKPSIGKVEPGSLDDVPYVGLEHIERDTGVLAHYGSSRNVRSTKSIFKKGDLLYGKLRPYLNKVWLAEFDGICSTDLLVYPQTDRISNNFLKYSMMSPIFVEYAVANSSGVNLPRVSASVVASFSLWLPAPEEQNRIVAELEKQFTRLDVGVRLLRSVQAKLPLYRSAVLKSAFEGKLVQRQATASVGTKRNPGGGQDLLKDVLAARKTGWAGRGKYKEPVAPHTRGLPDLTEGWAWVSTDQLSSHDDHSLTIGPFGSNLKVSDYTSTGVPLIFVRNIRSEYFGPENQVYVTPSKARSLSSHLAFGGDVLITKMGGPPGDACLYPKDAPTAVITADCIRLRVTPLIADSRFIVHAINSHVVKGQILGITKGVAQLKVNLTKFREVAIPLPSIHEQQRITDEIERRYSLIGNLESAVEGNLIRAERLRRAILHKAFPNPFAPDGKEILSPLAMVRDPKARKIKVSNTPMKKQSKKSAMADVANNVSLGDFIVRKYGHDSFTFASLSSDFPELNYDELRDELFSLLRPSSEGALSVLEMTFDSKNRNMQFTLRKS